MVVLTWNSFTKTGPMVKSQHLSESVGETVRFQRRVNIGIMHGLS